MSSSSRSRSRSHRRYRSRSRSNHSSYSRSYSPRRDRSRSRSYSYSRRRMYGYRRRDYSTSPLSRRKRHLGRRDNPDPTKCLGIFGLSARTTEGDLMDIFDRYPGFRHVNLVLDKGTMKSRGFAFLQFSTIENAEYVKKKCAGMNIDDRPIRIDFSITERAHTPTPGIYMGRPTVPRYYERRSSYSRSYRDRSRGRRSRYSRSPSYSPRRY